MSRLMFNVAISVATLIFSAPAGLAHPIYSPPPPAPLMPSARQERVNHCEIGRYICLNNIGAGPRFPSAAAQCRISYDQCRNR